MAERSQRDSERSSPSKKRTRLVRPYPSHTLEDALVVASTIHERNAGLPFDRIHLAKAMGTTPSSSNFMMKLNSSAKYGLTQGGYKDERIAMTPRGESVVVPQHAVEREQALLEAAMQPEPLRRFYTMLNGHRIPDDEFARNTLQAELGIHAALTEECLAIIKANGLFVGILSDIGGSLYVSLSRVHAPDDQATRAQKTQTTSSSPVYPTEHKDSQAVSDASAVGGKIFIGHSGSSDIADSLTRVLDTFNIPYAVVESDEGDPRPLTGNVSEEMRSCTAAVLVFARGIVATGGVSREVDKRLSDKLLYQLGAASLLYGDRVLALREEDLDSGVPDIGFRMLEFKRDHLDSVGLPFIRELYQLGVIDVRATGLSSVAG